MLDEIRRKPVKSSRHCELLTGFVEYYGIYTVPKNISGHILRWRAKKTAASFTSGTHGPASETGSRFVKPTAQNMFRNKKGLEESLADC
ncbi:hypothetical protein CO026_00720 [Candidatus Kaiserbacteria bacterium CG_4_9_14_0_2_um_filter_41_32]|uniref:Uncharacterized protein n=1 Tax=Candidatus Kaiserbacteria bacterium CG_4_9_14_0_2_um_filter_41_32 TaxID=1974601 RepID=A0A2M8FFJ9_9BACT|nr:MAG: hypothetical protein CO026_00720 [Candidatus Kaiserbacteria bacterium CG_4_9_14_0_2_um_filter_41_32]